RAAGSGQRRRGDDVSRVPEKDERQVKVEDAEVGQDAEVTRKLVRDSRTAIEIIYAGVARTRRWIAMVVTVALGLTSVFAGAQPAVARDAATRALWRGLAEAAQQAGRGVGQPQNFDNVEI